MGKHVRHRAGLWLGALVMTIGLFVFYQVTSKAQPQTPVIDRGQLRSHLQTLSSARYTDSALARTRAYLTEQLRAYGYTPSTQPFGTGANRGINLSVSRVGTNTPEHKILVGAHYDTVANSPGADDNASAVATALEIAHLFATVSTDKTLQIVFFDQEEQQPKGAGLLGSSAFVNDTTNLQGLDGAVILEMLGYACYDPGCQRYPPELEQTGFPDQGDFISVIGDADHPALLATFATSSEREIATGLPFQSVTLSVPVGVLSSMPDLFRSDHAPFWLKGIGAVMVSDTANFRNPNYHQPSDTVESLDFEFLEQTANFVIARLETLLNKPSKALSGDPAN